MKNNENKKSSKKPLVAVSMALLLALIAFAGVTTGQSYAKYITQSQVPSNQATVAQWGVVINANTTGLFGRKFGEVNENLAKVSGTNTVVVSADAGNVVAPGTTGSMTLSFTGKPEVNSAVALQFDAATFSNVNVTDNNDGVYYPMVWTVKHGSDPLASYHTVQEALQHVADKINGVYAANTDLSTKIGTYELTWTWAFADDATTANAGNNTTSEPNENILDTYLGNSMVIAGSLPENWTANTTFKFGASISVEQSQAVPTK